MEVVFMSTPEDTAPSSSVLRSEMTFETFNGHSGVAFSLAAAQRVAEQPGGLYNPLYFFGPSGVGKTHLLQAIGHALRKSQPELTVIYVTANDFSDELVQAMIHRKIDAFREHYRLTCDVLLLDNLQDLAHRERTQEEVFYTFVKLRERGCQIIAAGDRYPKDLPNLPDRLKSRFDQGLVADLQPPDTDGKVRILKRIVDTEGVHVPDGILRHIIHRCPADLHRLAGALRRVIALATFHEVAIDRFAVDQYLDGYLPDVQRGDPEAIILTSCQDSSFSQNKKSPMSVEDFLVDPMGCVLYAYKSRFLENA